MTLDKNLRDLENAGTEIDSSSVFYDVLAWIGRFVILGRREAIAVTLWVMLSHVTEITDCAPYLAITSPEKGSGKTRLLETLELVVARPWLTGRTTPAVLVRKIDKEHPTTLLDESDANFGGNKEYAEALRGVLNTGHLRSGKTSLCVAKGRAFECVDFSTFGLKAIAGIGSLPDTVADRSVPIRIQRKLPTEAVDRFRRKHVAPDAALLRKRLEAWAALFVVGDYPEPVGLDVLPDRAADIWEPMLKIAESCEPQISEMARAAAEALCGRQREDESSGVRILRDVRTVFDERDRMASAELAAELAKIEESPWAPRFGRACCRSRPGFVFPGSRRDISKNPTERR